MTIIFLRFGPGAVIYWFGFVDELADVTERGILLLSQFPQSADIAQLQDRLQELPRLCLDGLNSNEDPSEKENPSQELSHSSDEHLTQQSSSNEFEGRFYNYVDPIFDSDTEDYS